MRRLRSFDLEAVAGIVAAVVALVLHLLHVADEGVLLAVALAILALLLVRDLRRETQAERMAESVAEVEAVAKGIDARLRPPDTLLVGPRELRPATEAFARRARGEMTWFNVCLLMFRPQSLFDALLRPAIENPSVSVIQFVLDEAERERWEVDVVPKVRGCAGWEKVREPLWRRLEGESVSFILCETAPKGATEAHLSFWGEPFMARTGGGNVPRYVFHVQAGSELLVRLSEMERAYRMGSVVDSGR